MSSDDSLSNIFEEISQVTGVEGLKEIYQKSRRETSSTREVEAIIRDSLPNKQPKKLFREKSKKNRKKTSQNKVKTANIRLLGRLKKKVKDLIGHNFKPKFISADLWYDCYTIVWDRTGKAIREFSRICLNKIAISRIHRAALGMVNENGERAYSYYGDSRGSVRARSIFAVGWLLLNCAKKTRRKGPYNLLVCGIPQSAIIDALSGGRKAERIFRTTLSGVHRYTKAAGEIGYLDALKESGFCYTRQAKWTGEKPETKGWEDIRPNEVAGSRDREDENKPPLFFSLARYWIITSRYNDSSESETRADLWADHVAGNQPLEQWLTESVPIQADVHEKTSGFLHFKPPD